MSITVGQTFTVGDNERSQIREWFLMFREEVAGTTTNRPHKYSINCKIVHKWTNDPIAKVDNGLCFRLSSLMLTLHVIEPPFFGN